MRYQLLVTLSVLYEMAHSSETRINKQQRKVVMCLTRPKLENKEKEEHEDFLHLRLRFFTWFRCCCFFFTKVVSTQ